MVNILKVSVLALLSLCCAQAQEASTLARHPGETVKYQISFSGENADRIKAVYATLSTGQAAPKDQVGFQNNFATNGQIPPTSPRTFVVEMKIPDNAASGDYHLYVTAYANEGSANYADRQEFTIPPIHVENPKKFSPPSITVSPLH